MKESQKNMLSTLLFYFHTIKRPLALYLGLEFVLRIVLMWLSKSNISLSILNTVKIFSIGFSYDIAVGHFLVLPIVLYTLFSPQPGRKGSFFNKTILGFFIFGMVFKFAAEILFWEEFQSRFNFIAVDYLVYTHEVSNNIRESYDLGSIFTGLFAATGILFWGLCRYVNGTFVHAPKFSSRLKATALYLLMLFGIYEGISDRFTNALSEQVSRDLSFNGTYGFAKAFFENSLDYNRFYLTSKDVGAYTSPAVIASENTVEHKYNVILVLMESMSAEFMARYGNKENLTPSLDKFANEALVFDKLYATGTRTVRGIEATVLSIPPLPGQSVVKRPGNENLRSLGFEFKKRGYTTQFIYGGHSYFDNMKHFFSHNGFDIVDKGNFDAHEITFENAWGVCDEDLFTKVIQQADLAHKDQKPFMIYTLTTSNHRPYTYPEGKIDLLPKVSHRPGGVKYSDYAIGRLVEEAKKKPWFDNTIFIFVADHTAGTVGKLEINPKRYHIPAIFYAPKIIEPKQVTQLVSQIDLPVTLMGILGFAPNEKMFGRNALRENLDRAFISNFQKLGFVKGNELIIFKPGKECSVYKNEEPVNINDLSENLVKEAVSYFEAASDWKTRFGK